ncbi:MAG: 2,3-diaminopropionate biosynthesis protein SbnB [Chitinophagaceae bacterium]
MLYLNTAHIEDIGIDWHQLINVIKETSCLLAERDYAQPIKPYLRYGDTKNRIIAMPAYVGGEHALAGIKWIASFPDNINKGKLRAHSVTILNEAGSGVPLCTLNTTMISAIRTAAVSGLVIKEFVKNKQPQKYTVGITGFGPIGRTHLKMVESILGNSIEKILLYDLRPIDRSTIESRFTDRIVIAGTWQECYDAANIFITCTVSDKPYVDRAPQKGSLQLNVSLRDFSVATRKYMDVIIVDDWDEVCRQNTDIENMHKELGLQKEDTLSIADIACGNALENLGPDDVVMFNPMGMAVFDIAVGGYYYREAAGKKVGMLMPD